MSISLYRPRPSVVSKLAVPIAKTFARTLGRVAKNTAGRIYDAYQNKTTPYLRRRRPAATMALTNGTKVYTKRPMYANPLMKRKRKGKGKSIFKRKFKKMRKYNRAKLHLQNRLQLGENLPYTSFCKAYYRGSSVLDFGTNAPMPAAALPIPVGRSFCLNDISTSPWLGSTVGSYAGAAMNTSIRWNSMWQTLYEQYLVLGAKMNLTIKPCAYPNALAPPLPESGGIQHQVPFGAQPGYYYIRAYYKRAPYLTADDVGHPIGVVQDSSGGPGDDDMAEDYWPTLKDFLSDPTVTWKKDPTVVRQQTRFVTPATIDITTGTNVLLTPTSQVEYSIESSNKPINLSVTFSAKKHFEEQNIMRNGTWATWDTSLADSRQFRVRFGYIGFNGGGTTDYHIPLDRNFFRFCEVDIRYFVALRNPRIGPSTEFVPPTADAFMRVTSPDTLPAVKAPALAVEDPLILDPIDEIDVEDIDEILDDDEFVVDI